MAVINGLIYDTQNSLLIADDEGQDSVSVEGQKLTYLFKTGNGKYFLLWVPQGDVGQMDTKIHRIGPTGVGPSRDRSRRNNAFAIYNKLPNKRVSMREAFPHLKNA